MSELSQMLPNCRRLLGDPPRKITAEQQERFTIKLSWFERLLMRVSNDPLFRILRDQSILRDQGRIVWGGVIQANEELFKPTNKKVLPAVVVYSLSPELDEDPESFEAMISAIRELTGRSPRDRDLLPLVRAVTNEYDRNVKLEIPDSIAQGSESYLTNCLIQPSHLPEGFIAAPIFPVLAFPEKTDFVTILPAEYWGEEVISLWTAAAD